MLMSHAAYTMAKYGMSMCALGMAEEFRDEGIAVNTLWPRTGWCHNVVLEVVYVCMELVHEDKLLKVICKSKKE